MVAYGVGDILGAGIYALVGKIAGIAGQYCWISFMVALIVASFTALSYAELGSRFPKSGGEATFCKEGFRRDHISFLIGWLVLFSGIVSMATISKAFSGYLLPFLPDVPQGLVITAFLLVLTIINFVGIREASSANIVCTLIEVGGLIVVIGAGVAYLWSHGVIAEASYGGEPFSFPIVLQAGALAFFAFIGFEDMVNVAEEVEAPEHTLPKAIIVALIFSSLLYMMISVVAVRVVAPSELASSTAPLLEVVKKGAAWFPVGIFTAIALFAVSNTSLLNFITGSRLIYGMASQGLLPAVLGKIHPKRRTPHVAIMLVFLVTLILALSGSLTFLAGTTSTLILIVFIAVNSSLVFVKMRREQGRPRFSVPMLIPVMGVLTSLGLIFFVPRRSMVATGVILLFGLALLGIYRKFGKIGSPLRP